KAIDALTRARRARLAGRNLPNLDVSRSIDPELSHLLHSRTARLPDRLRQFYCLRYREGLSQREAGKRLGLGPTAGGWMERQCLRMVKGRLTGNEGAIAQVLGES